MTAIAPSPTADATRFTDWERTSPATKTPGLLDSSGYGSRSGPQPAGRRPSVSRSVPVFTNPAVSRATAPLADLWTWFERAVVPRPRDPEDSWQPGLVCLKGGDLEMELGALREIAPAASVERIPLGRLLGDSYFDGKEIVAVAAP